MNGEPRFKVVFYKTLNGKEPVRDWLKLLPFQDKKKIGENIKTVQFGFPLGMPLIRKLETDLWEVRIKVSSGSARIFFTIQSDLIVLLHAYFKKSNKAPSDEINLARKRMKQVRGDEW